MTTGAPHASESTETNSGLPTDFRDPTPESDTDLKRVLGSWDLVGLGFGAMIGFGWVVLTGGWIDTAGTLGAVIAMIIGGAIMAAVGLVYAELTAAMPRAGGEFNYLARAFGSRTAFFGSWAIAGGYAAIVAFEAVALPRTIAYIWPDLNTGFSWEVAGSEVFLPWALVGAITAVAVLTLNVIGVKQVGIAQNFVVFFLVAIGLVHVAGGVSFGELSNMEPLFADNPIGGILAVVTVVPFLFVGFNVIPQASEEAKVPAKRIGWLVVIAVAVSALWYVIIVLATSSAAPGDELAAMDIATADAMGKLWNSKFMANVLISAGIAGILTSWIALLLGASRIIYVMGRGGMLPAWFGKLHPKFRTPANSILFVGLLSAVAPFFGENMLGWLVDGGSALIIVAYAMVSFAFIRLRKIEPEMPRPIMAGGQKGGIPLGWLSTILCIGVFSLYMPGLESALDIQPWIIFFLWWAIGIPLSLRTPKVSAAPDAPEQLLEIAKQRRLNK